MRINYVVFRIGRKLILIAEQWYKWHGDIIDSKHVKHFIEVLTELPERFSMW